MKLRIVWAAIALLVTGLLALAPLNTTAAPARAADNPFTAIPVTGSNPDGATFAGQLDIVRFAAEGDQLIAHGTLSGDLTAPDGTTQRVGGQAVAWPVAAINGTPLDATQPAAAGTQQLLACEILTLDLGELDLNLLGLNIFLDDVLLEITAEPLGGLLGQLLCAVANLLNLGDLFGIANLLNQILDLFS